MTDRARSKVEDLLGKLEESLDAARAAQKARATAHRPATDGCGHGAAEVCPSCQEWFCETCGVWNPVTYDCACGNSERHLFPAEPLYRGVA